MKCPHCGQEHPDSLIECPSTRKMLKRACPNKACPYFGEYIWPLEKETCPCCGKPLSNTINGHEFVDLGLSVKWATCNVGAMKPEDYGGYYQWAGTKDVSSTGIYLDDSNCPYHTGSKSRTGWTKYNTKSSFGKVDNKTVLDPCDDAAHINWCGSWRMPTGAEWRELKENCIWTWTTQNGVKGYKVTSIRFGYNKSIFLPAAGYCNEDDLLHAGSYGSYWSSSLYTIAPSGAYNMYFYSDCVYTFYFLSRYNGKSIRPVSE